MTDKMSSFYARSVTGGLQRSEFLVNARRTANRYSRLCKHKISRLSNGLAEIRNVTAWAVRQRVKTRQAQQHATCLCRRVSAVFERGHSRVALSYHQRTASVSKQKAKSRSNWAWLCTSTNGFSGCQDSANSFQARRALRKVPDERWFDSLRSGRAGHSAAMDLQREKRRRHCP
jgi:hypothetical protein